MSRKLIRTREDYVIAGVCGGIARYFSIDVVIVRILWVLSAVLGGFGVGTYIICAIIIPKEKRKVSSDISYERVEDFDELEQERNFKEDYDCEYDNNCNEERNERTKKYLGVALIFMGAMIAFDKMFPNFSFKYMWPVIFIGAGLFLLNRNDNEGEE